MVTYAELERSKYIVWINLGGEEGWQPRLCQDWEEVMSEILMSSDIWIITKPVRIPEPFGEMNNLR